MSHGHKRNPRPETEGSSFNEPESEAVGLAGQVVNEVIAHSMVNHMKCACVACMALAKQDAQWLIEDITDKDANDLVSQAGSKARKEMVANNRRRLGK